KELPSFLEKTGTTRIQESTEKAASLEAKEKQLQEQLWPDEETRSFYEDIPDIKALIEEKKKQEAAKTDSAQKTEKKQSATKEEQKVDKETKKEEKKDEKTAKPEASEKKDSKTNDNVDQMFERLPHCCSRTLITEWANE